MSTPVNKKQISLSNEILREAQRNADVYFNGNLSAYLSHLVISARECSRCRNADEDMIRRRQLAQDMSCNNLANQK